jgi:hypothetical protein
VPKSGETGAAGGQSDEGMPFADFGPEGEYLKARQAVQLLKAERDTLSQDLRPRHPKIIKLNDEIDKQEKLIDLYREDAVQKLDTPPQSDRQADGKSAGQHQGMGEEGARA